MGRVFKLCLLACLFWGSAGTAQAFDHEHAAWTRLLATSVHWDTAGGASTVDYGALQAQRPALDDYLAELATVPVDEFARWPWPQRQAFLINAYNAATVSLVLTGHPGIDSIRDLGGLLRNPWRKAFVPLFGKTRSLDQIEHELLRGDPDYRDPRIHFAVNCASIGCPALRPEAFTAQGLETQLADQTRRFLSDRSRNRYLAQRRRFEVSPLFDWYAEDFAAGGGVTRFLLAQHAALGIDTAALRGVKVESLSVAFTSYDWNLNQ
ncbi:DUF547 domain-containing protein [Arenimonas alkanexedens]